MPATRSRGSLDWRSIFRTLHEQGFGVEQTARGHFRVYPPDPSKPIVHISLSEEPRAIRNAVLQLRKSGFEWRSSERDERDESASREPRAYALGHGFVALTMGPRWVIRDVVGHGIARGTAPSTDDVALEVKNAFRRHLEMTGNERDPARTQNLSSSEFKELLREAGEQANDLLRHSNPRPSNTGGHPLSLLLAQKTLALEESAKYRGPDFSRLFREARKLSDEVFADARQPRAALYLAQKIRALSESATYGPTRDPEEPHVTPEQRAFIAAKIPVLVDEGYPQAQAIAIAYRMAGVPPLPTKKRTGFALLNTDQRSALSKRGGRASYASGKGHRFDSESASAPGKKGGRKSRGGGRPKGSKDKRPRMIAGRDPARSEPIAPRYDILDRRGHLVEFSFTSVGAGHIVRAISRKEPDEVFSVVLGPHVLARYKNGKELPPRPARPRRDPARLTTRQRRQIPARLFALPERRALPIEDPARIRNAAARLAQMKKRGTVTPAEYRLAKARIVRAERENGIGARGRR